MYQSDKEHVLLELWTKLWMNELIFFVRYEI